jgi:hypothetical protein
MDHMSVKFSTIILSPDTIMSMTDKSGDRYGGANTEDKDYHAINMAWSWVNVIVSFYKAYEDLVKMGNCPNDTTDFTVRMESMSAVTKEIEHAHAEAERWFLLSTTRSGPYGIFQRGRENDQLGRGIITVPEYWQAFARFLSAYRF